MSILDKFNEAVIALNKQMKDDGFYEAEGSSPAVLRNALLRKLSSGTLRNDISTLKTIFNHSGDDDSLELTIKKNTDRFRSVQNLINEGPKTPSQSNINLLSILIDFQPRPYNAWREKYLKDEDDVPDSDTEPTESAETKSTTGEDEIDKDPPITTNGFEAGTTTTGNNKDEPAPLKRNWKLKDKKSLTILSSALVITLLMAFYSWPHKQCMYWDGEKYIAIHCDEVDPQLDIIALNSEKQQQFKRITRKDTLTKDHVNKVWYSKIDTEVEFFTCPGLHPVHPHRSLKAATEYIIEKYAMGKVNNEKGAVD